MPKLGSGLAAFRVQQALMIAATAVGLAVGASPASAKPRRHEIGVLLGHRAVEGVPDSSGAREAQAFRYRAIRSGAVRSIFVYVGRGSRATALAAGVYTNADRRPSTLLAHGSRRTRKTGAWIRVTVAAAGTVVRGRFYWIAVRGSGGTLRLHVRGSSCTEGSKRAVAHLPRQWRSRRPARCSLAAYATGVLKPVNKAPPAIYGSPVTGHTLAATAGKWRNKPSRYSYQWQACLDSRAYCVDISGANANVYKISDDALGLRLRVLVGVANAAGEALGISALTAPVASTAGGGLLNTSPPTVSGEAVPGQTISTTNGSWSSTPVAYAYQWEDCDASGAACSSIPGANTSTYTVAMSDLGDTIRVLVGAVSAQGSAFAISGSTAVVSAAAAHTETWAYDDCGNGLGASAALVRQWLTFAETNCGPDGATTALSNCHSAGVVYCEVIQYLDTNVIYYSGGQASDQWPAWQTAAQESWYLHEAPPNQSTRISTSGYGGGYFDNVANPSVIAFYQNYVRQNFPDQDGLMMDDTSPGLPELLYDSNDAGATSTGEIISSAVLQLDHQLLEDSMTRPNGTTYLQITNGLADGGNPNEADLGIGPTGNQITTTAPGIISEGSPEDNGSLDPWYPGLLDDMAYIDDSTSGFLVLLSNGAAGASYQSQSRLVQEATVLLGYEPGRVVDWAALETGNSDLAVWPEEGIYPTDPLQTMGNPGGSGCLAGTGSYCSTGGHNDLQVATGVYRREFADCFDQGAAFGSCAAIMNTTGSPVTVSSSWLTQTYSHSITLSGGDVQSGGTIDLTGTPFSAGTTQVPADSALILTGP